MDKRRYARFSILDSQKNGISGLWMSGRGAVKLSLTGPGLFEEHPWSTPLYLTHQLHTVFKNVSVDVNEPRAMKFVVQRSNQHFAISFIKRFRRSLLFEIPAESEGQWVHVQFSPNVICPLCSQAWLAAVSWLDDEVRPAVAQMVWFHIKTRGKLSFCFLQIKIFQ